MVARVSDEDVCVEVHPEQSGRFADLWGFSMLDFRYPFAYALSMFPGPSARKTFVVACKKCRRDVPIGMAEFPFQSIIVACPLCGEKRRYLPSEVFLGRVDQLVNGQKRAGAV